MKQHPQRLDGVGEQFEVVPGIVATKERGDSVDYTSLSKGSLYFSFALVTSLFFLWGLSYGLVDVLNKHFLNIFGLSKTQSALLQLSYFGSYLLIPLPVSLFIKRFGYKNGIHLGLGLFSCGTALFWAAAHVESYGMFVAFTFITGSGLATLEVAANSYIAVLGPPRYAATRLVAAQSANGVATVIGPLIAANTFFQNTDERELGTVQYVYIALSSVGIALNIGVFFATLPEIVVITPVGDEERLQREGFFRQWHTIFGVIAEFFYVGAQVAVASFAIFYITEVGEGISDATASSMFSGCQAVFTVGRLIGIVILRYIDPAFLLGVHGLGLLLFTTLTATVNGKGGIACLFFIFLFESICYPVIFTVATADLGSYTKYGSGLLSMGVSGGAWYPLVQGVLADAVSSHRSYFVALTGFAPLTVYGWFMWHHRAMKHAGRLTIWSKDTDLIINPAQEGGLNAYNDEKFDAVEEERIERSRS